MTTRTRNLMLVAAGIALTSAGHYLVPSSYLMWHGIFQRLYYIPVVYAAVAFGWRGGLAAAALSGLLYLPHISMAWAHMQHYKYEQYAEIVMFFAVGGVTGVLADRLRAANRELETTFEQVRRADRLSAIGQLAAGLAHEIRNPLASIDGAAEVIGGGAEGETKRETLDIIRQECARLNRLLTSLLDFARPRAPERKDVDLSEVASSVVQLMRHSAGKGIRFETEWDAGLPSVKGDREQLAQVLLNLALNASQAMPDGGVVRIAGKREKDAVVLEVVDEGAGIADEDLERIFDPFFTTKGTGTGLGLPVVHQIVTQHGGTVSASHNSERGMTFRARFPLARGGAS